MEVIIGCLLGLILASVLLHVVKIGVAMYKLNGTTQEITRELEKARIRAMANHEATAVIFEAKEKRFGLDRNNNGKLESGEASDLPDDVQIEDNGCIIFTETGSLSKRSKEPKIVISNARDSRKVSVSAQGAIEVD